VQYPHQTTSGRPELAASKDINSNSPASRFQEQKRSPKRTEVEPSVQKLTSHAPQYGPAVHDFQHRRHPSSVSSHPSSPKSTSTLPEHASSSPPRESTFAIDFDVGNSPKTLTRNKIQIPPRTRYAPQHMNTAMPPDSNYFQQLDTQQQQRQHHCQQYRRHPTPYALYWQASYHDQRLVLRTYYTRHHERYQLRYRRP
jgi:hypothetical protein